MNARSTEYLLPHNWKTADDTARRVGFELEFSGINLDDTVAALQSVFRAEVVDRSAAECTLRVAETGDFGVEIDWRFLKRLAAGNADDGMAGDILEQLSQLAALLVPMEVVCPPIPMDRLALLDPLVDALRKAGAVGTEETLIAAYGVHINPEIPSLDPDTLLAYVQAFCLLQWWLVDKHPVDMARRISPYIDLYPESYLLQVMERETADFGQIFDDYLEHNATRNRALDLLPLLAMVDEERISLTVADKRVNKRPTFHYRLPDCHIENPAWSLRSSWNTWLVVERLASQPEVLETLRGEFLNAARPVLGVHRRHWVEWIDQWLKDRQLA